MGINTIGELAKFDTQKLIAVFGRTLGIYFHNAALGVDDEPVQEKGEPESISRMSTLKQDNRDLGLILEKTDQLCNEIHKTVVEEGLAFKTVGITVIVTDMNIHTRSKTLENPTNNVEVMKKAVRELLDKFLGESELEARRVGVKISNLARPLKSQRQLTSFLESNED
jgi:nucleotidyltransferase/DNA polymerase involved in DNA repair